MDGIFLTTELLPTGGERLRSQNTVDAFLRPIDILYIPDARHSSGFRPRSDRPKQGYTAELTRDGADDDSLRPLPANAAWCRFSHPVGAPAAIPARRDQIDRRTPGISPGSTG